jgi:hypothetical protein
MSIMGMKRSAKRAQAGVLVIVLLTMMALLLASCTYERAFLVGEKAEEIRVKVEELLDGFLAGSGWCSTSIILPFLLSGAVILTRRSRQP